MKRPFATNSCGSASRRCLLLGRFAVGLFFLAALVAKWSDWDPYRRAVIQSFPEAWRPPTATLMATGLVMGAELFVGVAMFSARHRRAGAVVAFGLCLVFALVVGPIYDRLGGSCGCAWRWMPIAPRNGIELILADLALAAVAVELFVRERQIEGTRTMGEHPDLPRRRTRPAAYLLILVVGLAAVLRWTSNPLPEDLQAALRSSGSDGGAAQEGQPVGTDGRGAERRLPSAARAPYGAEPIDPAVQRDGPVLRVVDAEAGSPVGSAEIRKLEGASEPRWFRGAWFDRPAPGPAAVTDLEGRARLPQGLLGDPAVVVAQGYLPGILSSVGVDEQAGLEPLGASCVRFVGSTGELVPAVRVFVRAADVDPAGVTDEGTFIELRQRPGATECALPDVRRRPLRFVAVAEGCSPVGFSVDAGEGAVELTVRLRSGDALRGRLDPPVSDPAVAVHCVTTDGSGGPAVVAPVGPGGGFQLDGLDPSLDLVATPVLLLDGESLPLGPPTLVPPFAVRPPGDLVLEHRAGIGVVVTLDGVPPGRDVVATLVRSGGERRRLASAVHRSTEGGTVRITWPSVVTVPPSMALEVLELGAYAIEVEGHVPLQIAIPEFEAGAIVDLGTHELRAASARRVSVVEQESGWPVVGAEIEVEEASGLTPGPEAPSAARRTALSGPDGVAHLALPEDASFSLRAAKAGWESVERACGPGDGVDAPILLELRRLGKLVVQAVAVDGRPVTSGAIRFRAEGAGRWSVRSLDGEGRAEMLVPAGEVAVAWTADAPWVTGTSGVLVRGIGERSQAPPASATTVSVAAGETRHVELEVAAAARVQVRLHSRGEPLAGAQVACVVDHGLDARGLDLDTMPGLARGVSDDSGEVALLGVPEAPALLLVRPEPGGFVLVEPVGRWPVAGALELDLDLVEVELELRRIDDGAPVEAALALRLSGDGGAPLPEITELSASGVIASTRAEVGRRIVTDDRGRAVVPRVPVGARLNVAADEPSILWSIEPQEFLVDGTASTLDVRAGGGGAIVIELPAGPADAFTLRVTAEPRTGQRPLVRLVPVGATSHRIGGLAPGRYSIDAFLGDEAWASQLVDVGPGEQARVAIGPEPQDGR